MVSRRTSLRSVRILLAIFMLLVSSAGLTSEAAATSSTLCTGYPGCASAGYSDAGYGAASGINYWGMTPTGHNCTNYAAYRLIQNGVDASYLQGQGNAYQWGGVALSHGIAVDGNPRVGDIAWWDRNSGGSQDGHVAYVEQVSSGYIITSEDNLDGDFRWARLTPGGYYPTGFIHFGGAPNGGPRTATGITALSSFVDASGTTHIYSGTADGTVNESWFNASTNGANSWQAANFHSAINALSSSVDSSGTTHLYSGTADGRIYETWFRPGVVNSWQVAGPWQAITALSSFVDASGTTHIYSGTADGTVNESWFNASTNGANSWQAAHF
jgi:surface antigen